jgi:hypothetical protein
VTRASATTVSPTRTGAVNRTAAEPSTTFGSFTATIAARSAVPNTKPPWTSPTASAAIAEVVTSVDRA